MMNTGYNSFFTISEISLSFDPKYREIGEAMSTAVKENCGGIKITFLFDPTKAQFVALQTQAIKVDYLKTKILDHPLTKMTCDKHFSLLHVHESQRHKATKDIIIECAQRCKTDTDSSSFFPIAEIPVTADPKYRELGEKMLHATQEKGHVEITFLFDPTEKQFVAVQTQAMKVEQLRKTLYGDPLACETYKKYSSYPSVQEFRKHKVTGDFIITFTEVEDRGTNLLGIPQKYGNRYCEVGNALCEALRKENAQIFLLFDVEHEHIVALQTQSMNAKELLTVLYKNKKFYAVYQQHQLFPSTSGLKKKSDGNLIITLETEDHCPPEPNLGKEEEEISGNHSLIEDSFKKPPMTKPRKISVGKQQGRSGSATNRSGSATNLWNFVRMRKNSKGELFSTSPPKFSTSPPKSPRLLKKSHSYSAFRDEKDTDAEKSETHRKTSYVET